MADVILDKSKAALEAIAKQVSEAMSLEIVSLHLGRHRADINIQITADRPTGGITIDECTALNKAIVEAIDKEGLFNEDGYSLELSSPGLDSPLTHFKDFKRNLNADIHFWLTEPLMGKREVTGKVTAAKEHELTVFLKNKQEVVIPLKIIQKGLLVI